MGLFGERQQDRHEWIADGPRRGSQEAHAMSAIIRTRLAASGAERPFQSVIREAQSLIADTA